MARDGDDAKAGKAEESDRARTLSGDKAIAALLLSIDQELAAKVLRHFSDDAGDKDMRADLVHRVATLDRTPPDVVQRVLEVMRKKVKDLGLNTLRAEPKAWVKAVAQILNNMGGGEKAILDQIEAQDQQMAVAIREE